MTFQVGRCEIGRAPSRMDHDGNRLAVGGWFITASLELAQVTRQQILGLREDGAVPLVADFDTNLDGFYSVMSANVTPVEASYSNFAFQYAIDMQRVGGYSAPVVELTVSALERDPNPTASSISLVPYPTAATWKPSATHSRASETGPVQLFVTDVTAGTAFDLTFQYQIPPADFYDGAATIEQLVGGTWYPVVGRQLPRLASSSVRVGNGMVRATVSTAAVVSLEMWTGSAWESLVSTFTLGYGTISSITAFAVTASYNTAAAPSVLVNTPDMCVIRVPISVSDQAAVMLDISVVRGDRFVSFQGSGMPHPDTTAWTVCASTGSVTNSSAVHERSIYLTSNDANGNRWALASNLATSADTTDRGIAGLADDPMFVIACEVNGSSATTYDTYEAMVGQWWAATSISAQVVVS